MVDNFIKSFFNKMGFDIRRIPRNNQYAQVKDREMYTPLFCPSHNNGKGEFREIMDTISFFTLVSADRCHVLYTIAKQLLHVAGEFYECGVYKGGTAVLIAEVINKHKTELNHSLHLFDTFEGMPDTDREKDLHKKGDFADTSLRAVQKRLQKYNDIVFHPGCIPSTFAGTENHTISFAHIDVDIYKSVVDCCSFVYPRMTSGGMFVFDDYGVITCPGVRSAIDDFFKDKKEQPLILPTGQAVVFKI